MMKLFLEIWYSLPVGWRRVLTVAPVAAGSTLAELRWQWEPLAVGAGVSLVLFLLPGPSDSEKSGYHF